jgi:hypothetical protein
MRAEARPDMKAGPSRDDRSRGGALARRRRSGTIEASPLRSSGLKLSIHESAPGVEFFGARAGDGSRRVEG